jgi:hypothetical protein
VKEKKWTQTDIKNKQNEQNQVLHHEKMTCNDELFLKELRVIAEDGARDE